MKVIHFHRRPRTGFHSIENIYADVRAYLKKENIAIKKVQMPFTCKTHIGKILNIFYTFFFSADVYHITGDIHYIALVLPESKTVISAHNVRQGRRELVGWKDKFFKLLYFTIPNQHCLYWTTVSNYTKGELVDYLNIELTKVKVIYNPLGAEFTMDDKDFNVDKPSLLQVGTSFRKNISNLIKAIRNINCHLHIIGIPSKEEKKLLEYYNIEYTITEKANSEEMNDIYKFCDIMIINSVDESFGMPIIEAQQVGRVVIASEVTAMPEIAGQAAFYVNPLNIEEIEKGIRKVINNKPLRLQLIDYGFTNVKRFKIREIALNYLKLYKDIYHD